MKQIILFVAILLPLFSIAQLTGRVVDDNGEGIPFASISVKNNSGGTTEFIRDDRQSARSRISA